MSEKIKDADIELIMDFASFWFKFKPYSYQKRFLEACLGHPRVVGRWPRQSGKSQTVAVYVLFKALTGKNQILIVAPTQSQSKELYEKIRQMAQDNPMIRDTITKDSETEMKFENGSRIISLPCGPFGQTIKGYTADIVILEESGILKDMIVNTVIIPMIASKGIHGQIIKIGTPWTKNHFYDSCFNDKDYSVIKVAWPEVVEAGQYSLKFIEEQKKKLLDIEFRTEYEVEFLSDLGMFFSGELIDESQMDYHLIKII